MLKREYLKPESDFNWLICNCCCCIACLSASNEKPSQLKSEVDGSIGICSVVARRFNSANDCRKCNHVSESSWIFVFDCCFNCLRFSVSLRFS